MSIRQRTIGTISITLVILIVVLYFVLSAIVMKGFRGVEKEDAIKNVERVEDAFQNRINATEGSLFTWSQWTDSYNYIKDKNKSFEANNLGSTVFTGMNINFIFMVNKDFQIIYEEGYDLEKAASVPIPESLRPYVQKGSILFNNTDPYKSTKGFVILPEGPTLLLSAPITDTTAETPYDGFIVFARYFDTKEQQGLSDVTHLELEFSTEGSAINDIQTIPASSRIIDGKVSLKDMQGNPSFHLTVHIPREVYRQGVTSLRMLVLALIVVGLVFGIIIVMLLERIVLRRISALSKQVHDISENMNFDQRVTESGQDEISRLSRHVNGLIAAVSEIIHSLEQEK